MNLFLFLPVYLLSVIPLGMFEEVAPYYKSPGAIKTSRFGYPCPCKDSWEPICATDGYTYPNKCILNCARKVNKKLLGVCSGECPCCRAPFQNDPIEEVAISTGSSGWSPGWGWSWGPPPPPPPPPRPSSYPPRPPSSQPAPPPSSGSMGGQAVSGKPQYGGPSPSMGGPGPTMGGPYGYYGGPFRSGFLEDEDDNLEKDESDLDEKTEQIDEQEKDKTENVKLAFVKPGSTPGWGSCICTSVYSPICGSNNVTYANLCEFKCATKSNSCLTQACQGECPCCSCNPAVVYHPPS